MNHLTTIDEVERSQCHDPTALERWKGWLKVPPAQPVE
jgi:hypothetical protein